MTDGKLTINEVLGHCETLSKLITKFERYPEDEIATAASRILHSAILTLRRAAAGLGEAAPVQLQTPTDEEGNFLPPPAMQLPQ